jgi:putative tryptophan/tyrosine transport system substrate-binding protein
MNGHPTRRQFVQSAGVAGLGLVAGCWRLSFQDPSPARKAPIIGYLVQGVSEPADAHPSAPIEHLGAFRQGLAALGYVEGQNVVLEYRSGRESEAGLHEAAADLVRLPVDVLVTSGTPATRAAMSVTSTIPIVFAQVGDPVGQGLVASLAAPAGNVTGLANFNPQLGGKRVELLTQAIVGLQHVAYLWDPRSPAANVLEMQAATQALGLRLRVFEIREGGELKPAFEAASAEHADALVLSGDVDNRYRATVISLATGSRLPAMYPNRQTAREGGLMAYGANQPDDFRRAAAYVDKILKGTQPTDLPVEQPMRFDFVINLQTAQALRLTIPQQVLLQATEIIQ